MAHRPQWRADGRDDHSQEIFRHRHDIEPQRLALKHVVHKRLVGLAELSIRPWAEGCLTDHVGYLEGWYVEPDRRGRGIGRALLTAAEEWARREGCTEFASDTDLDNEAGRRAHLVCGFGEAGLIRCFAKKL